MNTPYNTGKVKIGCNYQPPKYVEQDRDMLLIQSYLIYDPAIIRKQNLLKLTYVIFITLLLGYLFLIT